MILFKNLEDKDFQFYSVQAAYEILKNNNQLSCKWLPVKTSKGNILELCGRNLDGKEFYKADILKKEDNAWCIYSNNIICSSFSIQLEYFDDIKRFHCTLILPNAYLDFNFKIKTVEEFLNFIDTEELNTKQIETEPEYANVVVRHNVIW